MGHYLKTHKKPLIDKNLEIAYTIATELGYIPGPPHERELSGGDALLTFQYNRNRFPRTLIDPPDNPPQITEH